MLDIISYRKNLTDETGPGILFFDWARKMVVDAFYTSPTGVKDIGYMGNTAVAKFEVPQAGDRLRLEPQPGLTVVRVRWWALALAFSPLRATDTVRFSHKVHAPLKLACTSCHAEAKTGERATYPAASVCINCHSDNKALAALPRNEPIEPKLSVYMLAEFAFFSHARHHAAKIECQRCHGDVWQMAEVRQVLPMTMKACVSCHRSTHAATGCGKCHELGQ